jgi:hypothetical protein
MTKTFELEQGILNCWNVVEDMEVLAQAVGDRGMTEDELMNALIGLKTIYHLKFQSLFETFEQSLRKE